MCCVDRRPVSFSTSSDNRARVEKLAAGRRVLNVFAYSGGFSLYRGAGGATEVVSLDSSAPALAAAERNFALNRGLPAVAACRHTTLAADAFEALAELRRRGERFDLVIVDPPAFAKQTSEVGIALQRYGPLAVLALGVLARGGTLVMASCSSRVSAGGIFRRREPRRSADRSPPDRVGPHRPRTGSPRALPRRRLPQVPLRDGALIGALR